MLKIGISLSAKKPITDIIEKNTIYSVLFQIILILIIITIFLLG